MAKKGSRKLLFHWDRTSGNDGLSFAYTGEAPVLTDRGLKVHYGPSWKNCRVLPEGYRPGTGSLVFEIEISGYDYRPENNGDIAFFLWFNGTASRLLYQTHAAEWKIWNGNYSIGTGMPLETENFRVTGSYDAETKDAEWYVDGVLIGTQPVETSVPDERFFSVEAASAGYCYIKSINVWEVSS